MKPELKEKLLALYTSCFEKYGDIEIACEGKNDLPIDRIVEFQGNLKKLSDDKTLKLAKSMFINGFCAPFFVFDDSGEYKLLDGHQRLKVLLALREAGIPIPGTFPVVEIKAENEKDARQKLLAITSQYGEFQKDVLDEWISEIDPDIADTFSLVDKEINVAVASLDGESDGEGCELDEDELVKLIQHINKIEKKTGDPVFTEIRDYAESLRA